MEKLRSRSDRFFLCKVATREMQEGGMEKKVIRQYAIEAADWAEAQHRTEEYLAGYGDLEIKDIKPSPYAEIFFNDDDSADMWFSVKLEFISFNEYRNKENRTTHHYLFQAGSLDEANKIVGDAMRDTLIDYTKTEIRDSKIFEVVEFTK